MEEAQRTTHEAPRGRKHRGVLFAAGLEIPTCIRAEQKLVEISSRIRSSFSSLNMWLVVVCGRLSLTL